MTDTAKDTDLQNSDSSQPEAVVRVDIDAAPDDVWRALTTDDGLAGWLGDGSSIGDQVGDEIDVNDQVTGQRKRGFLDEFTPGRRLGYTWWPETKPGDATRVAISLEPTHGGTRVTVVETRPLEPAARVTVPMASAVALAPTSSVPRTADWAWRAALLTITAAQPARVFVGTASGAGLHG